MTTERIKMLAAPRRVAPDNRRRTHAVGESVALECDAATLLQTIFDNLRLAQVDEHQRPGRARQRVAAAKLVRRLLLCHLHDSS